MIHHKRAHCYDFKKCTHTHPQWIRGKFSWILGHLTIYHIPSYTIKGLEVFTSRRGHPCFCPAPLEAEITKQVFFATPTTQVRYCPPTKKIRIPHNTHILTEMSGR